MMHPLHDYIAERLAERLKTRKVVVFYDRSAAFAPFIAELREGPPTPGKLATVSVAGISAQLARYDGSFFELRDMVEPLVCDEEPKAVILYVPGVEPDAKGSVLMELEEAGAKWEPRLRKYGRAVLMKRFTLGVVDELLAEEKVIHYEELARMAADTSGGEAPSMLKVVFHEAAGHDAMLAAWLASPERDADIVAKGAEPELAKLVRARLGLELASGAALPKQRTATLRYVLGGEFRGDLRCTPPQTLDGIPAPKGKTEEHAVRAIAERLRGHHAEAYPDLADRVEKDLGLRDAGIAVDALGAIDTFRFEEQALAAHCAELIAGRKFAAALAIVGQRERSFWLDRDVARKAQWEACRRMAELGKIAAEVEAALPGAEADAGQWVAAYVARAEGKEVGWYRLDRAQRQLETWVATLDDLPDEKALGIARRAHESACEGMAKGFFKALKRAGWAVPGVLHQTRIWSEVVASRPRPVAYFLVDAMRFEMGVELAERLPGSAEVGLRAALCALPSITAVGMAALMPGAAASFDVVEHAGDVAARIDEAVLPDVDARKKLAAARIPKVADITLDDLLGWASSKVKKRLEGAEVVIVRSQEIDKAGEDISARQARRIMSEVLGDLASAMGRLAKLGIEHAVVTADHGHLFASDRDESMRIPGPGGKTVTLHRRVWLGHGGSTPGGCERVSAAELGYASDLELIFLSGCGVFKTGGDLAFHHGGPSLQELVIPVLTVRLPSRSSARPTGAAIAMSNLPPAVSNRFFSVTLLLGGQNLSLFASTLVVRPVLLAGGKVVGEAAMAQDAKLDPATGMVTLSAGAPAVIHFRLLDTDAAAVSVVLLDPATDEIVCRSPADIPVKLTH